MEEIRAALPLVDFNLIAIEKRPSGGGTDSKGDRVFLPREDMRLDLEGMLKGYAAEEAARVLRRAGVRSALIDAGQSTIKVLGTAGDGSAWRIGLADPDHPDRMYAALNLRPGESASTTGDYQHFFVHRGRRYSHVLSPWTGYPARNLRAVTVLADDAALGDLLSTALFVLGPHRGMRLVEELDGVECVMVTDADGLLVSEGLDERLDVLEPER